MINKNILVVFGTRPEAIKMAPLVKELQKHSDRFNTLVCVTGQHRSMLDQVLDLFEIIPDYDLNIMREGQDLYDITSEVLQKIKGILNQLKPELVLVHGDTSTSTSAALAAFYQKIPVGHIEAGLRTNNIYSPWPEEMNRQITGRIAKYHFVPTEINKKNLLNEGINQELIFQTGNTVIDALSWVITKINNSNEIKSDIIDNLEILGVSKSICNLWLNNSRKLILMTGHRRENFGEGFADVCESIKELAQKHQSVDFIYPMHLNPNIRNTIKSVFECSEFNQINIKNIFFIEPLDYITFTYLMKVSYLILTDSGGIQEEAPSLGKPVLVMRDETERLNPSNIGGSILVGTKKSLIIKEVEKLLFDDVYYKEKSKVSNYYGDGNSSVKITKHIIKLLKL